jgi:catechol 2,3-dioxygenase-like lactoylglutathione lyase family enzyme
MEDSFRELLFAFAGRSATQYHPGVHIHHLALRVRDLGAAREFYCGLLGLQEMRRDDSRSIWLRAGDAVLMLERTLRGKGPDAGSGHVLALAAEDLALWEEKLTAAGVPIEDRTGETLFVRDPDGHRVALSVYRF